MAAEIQPPAQSGSFNFSEFLAGVTNVAEDWAKKELGVTAANDAGARPAPVGGNWLQDNLTLVLVGAGIAVLALVLLLKR